MNAPNYSRLKGRFIEFHHPVGGQRIGKVIDVDAGPRKGFVKCRVGTPSYKGVDPITRKDRFGWDGKTMVVTPENLAHGGVQFRGRVIPVEEFCREGGAA